MQARNGDDLDRLMRRHPDLPAHPLILARARQIASDARAGARELADVFLQDPSLTARLLRIANSAHYRRGTTRVTTVTHAIVLLGFRTLREMTTGLGVYKQFQGGVAEPVLRQLWRRALCSGMICRELAGSAPGEEAFITGLLHDIGIPILRMLAGGLYDRVEERVLLGEDRPAAERAVVGIDHAEAGSLWAKRWGFPPAVVRAARHHHARDRAHVNPQSDPHYDRLLLADAAAAWLFGHPAERHRWSRGALQAWAAAIAPIRPDAFGAFLDELPSRIGMAESMLAA